MSRLWVRVLKPLVAGALPQVWQPQVWSPAPTPPFPTPPQVDRAPQTCF